MIDFVGILERDIRLSAGADDRRGDRIAPAKIRVDTFRQELDEAYAKWEELESVHHEDTKA